MRRFEWDSVKDEGNIRKHGFGFARAKAIFDGDVITLPDRRRAYGEPRFIAIGLMEEIVVVTLAYTLRNSAVRIISARRASRKERKIYETYLASKKRPHSGENAG